MKIHLKRTISILLISACLSLVVSGCGGRTVRVNPTPGQPSAPMLDEQQVSDIKQGVKDARLYAEQGQKLALNYKNQTILGDSQYQIAYDLSTTIINGADSFLSATADIKTLDFSKKEDWAKMLSAVFTAVQDFEIKAGPEIERAIKALVDRGKITQKRADQLQAGASLAISLLVIAANTVKSRLE